MAAAEVRVARPTTLAEMNAATVRSSPPVMARTMAEKGVLCADCEHPYGRHEFEVGCVAIVGRRRARLVPCGCTGRPGRGDRR